MSKYSRLLPLDCVVRHATMLTPPTDRNFLVPPYDCGVSERVSPSPCSGPGKRFLTNTVRARRFPGVVLFSEIYQGKPAFSLPQEPDA
jgi:hypothetical protein